MNIQHKEGNRHSSFFIDQDGETVAEIVYSQGPANTIVIEHTEVDESLQGKNIGYELVQKTVEYAREKGLKITPLCTFAKAVIDKEQAFKDVLA
ncbi:MAG TPA: GNAT family N-acetyltransferase [Flavisolibacter sp.]|nr:GNAT family N-acetyltransferase [Flavisolibacter sp.]